VNKLTNNKNLHSHYNTYNMKKKPKSRFEIMLWRSIPFWNIKLCIRSLLRLLNVWSVHAKVCIRHYEVFAIDMFSMAEITFKRKSWLSTAAHYRLHMVFSVTGVGVTLIVFYIVYPDVDYNRTFSQPGCTYTNIHGKGDHVEMSPK